MARTPLNLDTRQITTTTLTTLYTAGAGKVASGLYLLITNKSTTANSITVTHTKNGTDFTLVTRTLPAGDGKSWIVAEVSGLKLNAGDSIKVQAGSATAYNTNLSGTEVE